MDTPETQAPPTATAGKVRVRDLSTSWEAAKSQKAGRVAAIQVAIYELLCVARDRGMDGMTHEEIVLRLGALQFPTATEGVYEFAATSSLRTRTAELAQAGWVVSNGKRRNKRGRMMTVWRAVLDGDDLVDVLPEPASNVSEFDPSARAMQTALDVAQWEGVDAAVARKIIAAYLQPAVGERTMREEMSA